MKKRLEKQKSVILPTNNTLLVGDSKTLAGDEISEEKSGFENID